MTWHDMSWNDLEMTWHYMTMTWHDLIWHDVTLTWPERFTLQSHHMLSHYTTPHHMRMGTRNHIVQYYLTCTSHNEETMLSSQDIALHNITSHCITLHHIALHNITSRWENNVTLRYFALRCVKIKNVTLRYVNIYVTLHHITWSYIT